MRPISLIIEVDGTLDKTMLLKSLLYLDEFFQLTSIRKLTTARNPLWAGLKIDQDERKITLIEGKERFITDIYTEVTPHCYLEFNDIIDFLGDQFHKRHLYTQFFGSLLIDIPKLGTKRVFREIQEVEWYYPERVFEKCLTNWFCWGKMLGYGKRILSH